MPFLVVSLKIFVTQMVSDHFYATASNFILLKVKHVLFVLEVTCFLYAQICSFSKLLLGTLQPFIKHVFSCFCLDTSGAPVLPHPPQPAFLTMPSPAPVLKAAFLIFLLHKSLKYIFNSEIITHILFRMMVISDISTTNTSIVSNDINHTGANITYIHKPILGSHGVVNCGHHKHHGLE